MGYRHVRRPRIYGCVRGERGVRNGGGAWGLACLEWPWGSIGPSLTWLGLTWVCLGGSTGGLLRAWGAAKPPQPCTRGRWGYGSRGSRGFAENRAVARARSVLGPLNMHQKRPYRGAEVFGVFGVFGLGTTPPKEQKKESIRRHRGSREPSEPQPGSLREPQPRSLRSPRSLRTGIQHAETGSAYFLLGTYGFGLRSKR